MSRSSIGPEGCPFIEACAIANVMDFQSLLLILSTSLISKTRYFIPLSIYNANLIFRGPQNQYSKCHCQEAGRGGTIFAVDSFGWKVKFFWWWRCSKCYFSVTFGATVFVLCALLNGSNGRLDLPAQKEEWSRQSKQIKVFSFRFKWIFFSLCSREFSGFSEAGSWYLFRTEIYRYCYDPYPSICHNKLLCCQHRN